MLDFNSPVSTLLNAQLNIALDEAALIREQKGRRDYLGASAIGSECLRKVQFDWKRDSAFPARTRRIFERGHASEDKNCALFEAAGFVIERATPACGFSAVDGQFQGHCDGIIHSGPEIAGLAYPCLWEHKCLGEAGWKKLEKFGLHAAYPAYYDQVQIYQAYLELTDNPALFTAENANTCHLLALLVPFDADAAQAASDRAVAIIRACAAGELLPRIASTPDDWRCKMCSHRTFCWSGT